MLNVYPGLPGVKAWESGWEEKEAFSFLALEGQFVSMEPRELFDPIGP